MNTLKKLLALSFVLIFAITGVACNKDDDETLLTTKKRKPSTTEAGGDIDIWAYLNGEGATDPSLLGGEEPGTLPSSVIPPRSSGNYTYEDIGVSFGGSSIFSSATTSKAGYPTFHWNPVSGAIRYNIYRSTSKTGTYTFLDSTTATSYTDKTAISGQKYFYQVKAVKKATPTAKPSSKPTEKPTSSIIPTKVPTPEFTTRDTSNAPATAPRNYTTIAEIVSLYNSAANKVKTDAKSVTRTQRTIQYIEDENNSSTVKTLLALAGVKENTDSTPQTFNTPATIRDEFPVEGKNISSTLTADMVFSASCTYDKGYYTVKIILKPDPEKTTDYSGTCINVFNPSNIISAAKSETRGCQILAKIYYDGTLDQVGQYAPTWVFADYQSNDLTVNGQQALSITEIWMVCY